MIINTARTFTAFIEVGTDFDGFRTPAGSVFDNLGDAIGAKCDRGQGRDTGATRSSNVDQANVVVLETHAKPAREGLIARLRRAEILSGGECGCFDQPQPATLHKLLDHFGVAHQRLIWVPLGLGGVSRVLAPVADEDVAWNENQHGLKAHLLNDRGHQDR